MKLGLFSGPLLPRKLGSGLGTKTPVSVSFGCSFSHLSNCCSASHANAVDLVSGFTPLCSTLNGLVGVLLVGVSGARAAGTCDGVRSFRRFFALVNGCTGMKCTRFGTLGYSNCTIGD